MKCEKCTRRGGIVMPGQGKDKTIQLFAVVMKIFCIFRVDELYLVFLLSNDKVTE